MKRGSATEAEDGEGAEARKLVKVEGTRRVFLKQPFAFHERDVVALRLCSYLRNHVDPSIPVDAVLPLFCYPREVTYCVYGRLLVEFGLGPVIPDSYTNDLDVAAWVAALYSFRLTPSLPDGLAFRPEMFRWAPHTHLRCSPSVRARAMTTLLICNRHRVPRDVRLMILKLAMVRVIFVLACVDADKNKTGSGLV